MPIFVREREREREGQGREREKGREAEKVEGGVRGMQREIITCSQTLIFLYPNIIPCSFDCLHALKQADMFPHKLFTALSCYYPQTQYLAKPTTSRIEQADELFAAQATQQLLPNGL